MTVTVELDGRTYHLRATMAAMRSARTEHGVNINTMGDDPLDAVTLAYHFARAGAKTQGTELTMTLEEWEEMITAADLNTISEALVKVMQVDAPKKKR